MKLKNILISLIVVIILVGAFACSLVTSKAESNDYKNYSVSFTDGNTLISFDIVSSVELVICDNKICIGNDVWKSADISISGFKKWSDGGYSYANPSFKPTFMSYGNVVYIDPYIGITSKTSNGYPDYIFYCIDNPDVGTDNMLVFDDYDLTYKYFCDGDTSGAVFVPSSTIKVDNSIEPPLNLSLDNNFTSFCFMGSQSESVEGRKIQIACRKVYRAKYTLAGGVFENGLVGQKKYSGEVVGDLFYLDDMYDNSSDTFNINIPMSALSPADNIPTTDIFDSEKPSPKYMWSTDIESTDVTYYFRNVVGNSCSEWVALRSTDTGRQFNVVDSDSNGNPTNNINVEGNNNTGYGQDYWNNKTYDIVSKDGNFASYIKNGFGLLGENGFLSILGNTFSFLPAELISILLFGASVLVIVGIIKGVVG